MTEPRRTRDQARAAGPLSDFGKWRATRNRKIEKPSRCKAADKLTQPKKSPEDAT